MPISTDPFAQSIQKTGFVLEFKVSETLREHGWTVINNKYYIDDASESVREIDLVAYRAKRVRGFYVYTALIVSCKKNEKNAWVLLAKDSNPADPNITWTPLHVWSNDRALSYMLAQDDWPSQYLKHTEKGDCGSLVSVPDRQIFAYQEMNRGSGNPQNDRNIFNSVTSLMKAQAYELNALPERKQDAVVYQFNLLSIIDAEVVRLDFRGDVINSSIINEGTYVANYIIDKQQTFARIHFIKADSFSGVLDLYDALHTSNAIHFKNQYDSFYSDAIKNHGKQRVFIGDLKKALRWSIWQALSRGDRGPFGSFEIDDLWFYWDEDQGGLCVGLDLSSEAVDALNVNAGVRSKLAQELKRLYLYDGESSFIVDDIPF